MDVLRTVKNNYSSVVFAGIALLVLACIFAFVEFSKVTTSDYTWRALCIVCFITGMVSLLGIVLFAGYGRYCAAPAKNVTEGARFNSSEIELNGQ
ncbi:MC118L [Molluscum contagiosum virus subtype 1]|uniref:MC118L n=3 Tax=Molluscum contagiosum virus TaxID=10279 RepID=A0A7G5AXB9_MCV1|nr:MC118L [Molluscum contagiosum virus subtype 1]AZT86336.1 MC118L [Molluscum contagiosum virus]AAC55246.1 MC118L [Molluscum contagiosum virus subtype 1]AQY16867.1 MC118 [Molluscum contagiosum virus subtype 1]AQY17046.1 MC118 [Molluscum contagiosum virus subtype 1]AQY17225.1 MC118 [Molluscum contagiosum virus subtype 1]